MAFAIPNIFEGFIEHGIFGIHLDSSVMPINAKDVSITFAAHPKTGPMLAAVTELGRVAFGRSNEDLSRAPE
jgi:hypothetical protein